MTDHIEGDEPEVDDADGERDDEEEIERAPQPGNTPAVSPPFDSAIPRERPDPDQ